MAVTKTTYTQAGATTQYAVPFEVIAAADIDVYIEGVLQLQQNTTSTAGPTHPQVISGEITQGTALINYTVAANNATITFNTPPTVGAFIVVERTTDDTLLETFVSGSTVRAADLNNAFERVLFIAQEGVNIASEALTPAEDEDNAFDANGDRISNLGDATDDNDAVNRGQLGKVITDDLIAGEGIDLTDANGGTNSGKQVTISAELSTASNPGVVQVNATTPITATYANPGELELSIADGAIDIAKIDPNDIVTSTEQDSGITVNNTSLFTTSAAAKRFDTLVQTGTPSGSNWEVGKTWLQNDANLTLSVWNGSAWLGIASGGTFTNQPKVVYVDATAGDDNNDGHRVSRPKATIKAAINQINADSTYGDGSIVVVAPGVYQEVAPIQIQKRDVSIVGTSLRSCVIHPTAATETETLFEVNSGTYLQNLTFTGVKASGTRGESGSLYEDATYGLPATQGWNIAFLAGATIVKSPYIQNCTNFSDSEIDNDNLAFYGATEDKGRAGDLDSAMTGGGLLVDGSVVDSNSPLRSMVCDSYTHVGLDGPGILVTNNGYVQATSSYAFFNHFHIACINGGQANLAASTTDFGRYSLIADGQSPTPIFTAPLSTNASDGDITFTIGAPTASGTWFGSATRPQPNMLVTINGITYPILSAVANGAGWDVTISRPDPANRSLNLGLNGAVTTPSTVSFFLRSMIASSGHTMEYVGSGTNYTALPENGGVPIEANQRVELNDGAIWTAITDHNGKFTVGDFFEVDQQLGYVTIPSGSIAFDLASDETPQLGGNLDVLNRTISSSTGSVVVDDQLDVNTHKIVNVTDPTAAQDAATKNYVDTADATKLSLSGGTMTGALGVTAGTAGAPSVFISGDTNTGIYSPGADQVAISTNGTGRLFIDSSGRVGVGTTTVQAPLHVGTASAWIDIGASAGNRAKVGYDSNNLIFGSSSSAGQFIFKNNVTSTDHPNSSGSELVRIDSSGRVGIGTNSPGARIHSVETSAAEGLRVDGAAGGFSLVVNGGTGRETRIKQASIGNSYVASTPPTDGLIVQGSVGIGTTSPNANSQLHIAGSSYQPLYVNTTASDGGGAAFLRSGTQALYVGTAGGNWLTGSSTADGLIRSEANLIFATGGNTQRAQIDSSGRLLVGTSTSPSGFTAARFVVQGNSSNNAGSAELSFQRGTTAASIVSGDNLGGITFGDSAGYPFASIRGDADGTAGTNDYPGRLVFSTTADGASSPTERVRIESTGMTKFSYAAYGVERTITAGAFDLATGNFWTCGAIAIPNPTNQVAGMSGLIRVTAAPTSFASNFKFPGGSYTAPATFPAIVPFYVQASGTILMGNWTEGIA